MSEVQDASTDYLLPDERVIWSASPAWDLAKPIPRWVTRHWVSLTFVVGSVALLGFSVVRDWEIAAVISAIVLILALLATRDDKSSDVVTRKKSIKYVLTDRRLIIDQGTESRFSLGPGAFLAVFARKNGDVHDVSVQHNSDENGVVTLHAVSEAETLEKLIVRKFLRAPRT